ncbi:CbiX/SirB N-terminal domain-containing protein, partial [Staphylococcus epidermidis]|uniref:CbiX/SirB N-terminal domain-containing protein n=1 Tax=Staphylococcus epidermidis TaxID=1282 RepID=UPI001C936D2E
IATLLKDEQYYYHLPFLQTQTQNLQIIIHNIINQPITKFPILPLLIFTPIHYITHIPQILKHIKPPYPQIHTKITPPLPTHPYIKTLLQNTIPHQKLTQPSTKPTILIPHPNPTPPFTKPHHQLKPFL